MNKLVVIYENDCGGETIATEEIISELKSQKVQIEKLQLEKLKKTSTKEYLLWIYRSITKSLQFIQQTEAQIATVYSTTFTGALAGTISKIKKKNKLIFHFHGSRLPDFSHKPTQIFKYVVTYLLHSLVFFFANHIVVPSNYSFSTFTKQFPLAKKEKITVIPNGIDLTKFHEYDNTKKNTTRKKIGIPTNKFVLSSLGRLNEKKRVLDLLHIFNILYETRKGIHLVIAFPPKMNPEEKKYFEVLKTVVTKYRINSAVSFLQGKKPVDIYNSTDLVVSLSQVENFPLILLEASACNTPFYSSNPDVRKIQMLVTKKPITEYSWEKTTKKIMSLI